MKNKKNIRSTRCYSGSKGNYSRKRNDSAINGDIFSFEVRIRRENGKIHVKEISDNRTLYSSVIESVRDDNLTDIMLLKCHLISEFLRHIEGGFNRRNERMEKIKKSSNDAEIKKVA